MKAAACGLAAVIAGLVHPDAHAASPNQPAAHQRDGGEPSVRDIVEEKTFDGLSIAPDGRHVAYRLVSRSVTDDRTVVQWFVQSLDRIGKAEPISRATEPQWIPMFSLMKAGVSLWSPASDALYVLELEKGAVQVHRLALDGTDVAVTSDAADVENFALSPAGDRLTYQTRAPRMSTAAASRREWTEGLHFDRTVATEGFPLFANHLVGERPTTVRRIADDDITGEVGAGPLIDKSLSLAPPTAPARDAKTSRPVALTEDAAQSLDIPLDGGGTHIRMRAMSRTAGDAPATSFQIVAVRVDGQIAPCTAFFCTGPVSDLREVTVNPQSGEVVILHERDSAARTALYGWNPKTGRTRSIIGPSGSLDGGPVYLGTVCPGTGNIMVCVQSGPTLPQRLIRIDLSTGSRQILSDPNADLAAKRYPVTRFLHWTDHHGNAANGVLVLPYDRTLRRPPLVITSYRCRGFLAGGTASLAPEFILAERGIAALCVNFNARLIAKPDGQDRMPPLGPHKAALDAYATIIDTLGRRGIIDPKRVGVAGHSFSANVVTYAISHTDLFKAAVIGSGPTIDPGTYPVLAPSADSWRRAVYDFLGMPRPEDDPKGYWKQYSPALNMRSSQAALLMQPPENEYLFCLQQYAYAQDAGAPTDMYIYPGEGHFASMMPLHQYWRNTRSVDWFDFWLNGHETPTDATRGQYRYWEILRSRQRQAASLAKQHG